MLCIFHRSCRSLSAGNPDPAFAHCCHLRHPVTAYPAFAVYALHLPSFVPFAFGREPRPCLRSLLPSPSPRHRISGIRRLCSASSIVRAVRFRQGTPTLPSLTVAISVTPSPHIRHSPSMLCIFHRSCRSLSAGNPDPAFAHCCHLRHPVTAYPAFAVYALHLPSFVPFAFGREPRPCLRSLLPSPSPHHRISGVRSLLTTPSLITIH